MSGWHHGEAEVYSTFQMKPCAVCGIAFKPWSGASKFCSAECKGKWKYISGRVTTQSQYDLISYDWKRYFSRLRQRHLTITRDQLLELLKKQEGKCALTKIPLTCQLVKGKRTWTNASMDRIVAGGPYSLGNVQLVCVAVNMWRGNQPLEQFIKWCQLVARNNESDYVREQKQKSFVEAQLSCGI